MERTLRLFSVPALSLCAGVTVRHDIEVPGPDGIAFRVTYEVLAEIGEVAWLPTVAAILG